MKTWELRPIEEAHLLNPAFCGELLRRAIRQYSVFGTSAFPYPLTFLVLPIVLHRQTRELISPNTREQLHVWLQNNQSARVGFAERAARLVPITNESLNFLLQLQVATIDNSAKLRVTTAIKPINSEMGDAEIRDCYRKAEIIGRWFARAGNPANVYTMWGVKP